MQRHFLILAGFALVTLTLAGCRTSPSAYSVVSQDDADILIEAKRLLSDESKWTRNEEMQCNLEAEQWTLFCALQKASYNVTGGYELRRIAIEDTRYIIERTIGSGTLERRLIDFNNLPATTFADVQRVLDLALQRVNARLAQLQELENPAQ
ncbi:MAG TPA: hypothetical protein VD713_06110 [Sphingomonadales bacterium]|nr:hypothetical protein [Sphingomonadales bacterium]